MKFYVQAKDTITRIFDLRLYKVVIGFQLCSIGFKICGVLDYLEKNWYS